LSRSYDRWATPLIFRAIQDRFLARYRRRQVGLVTRTE
jgi:hypothetical protein